MRILVVENGLGFGGALTSLKSFLDTVPDSEKLDFYILTSYPQNYIKPNSAVKKVLCIPRHRLYGPTSNIEQKLQIILGRFAGLFAWCIDFFTTNIAYAAKVYFIIKKYKIDIIHLNNSLLINDSALLGAALAGIPIIQHVRASEFIGKSTKILAKIPSFYLPVSNFVAKSLTDIGVGQIKFKVTPEGVDIQSINFQANPATIVSEFNLKSGIPVVGMIGCLVPWKGHKIFIEACYKILDKCEVNILIAGDSPDGDNQYKESLIKYAENLDIEKKLIFLGHRNDVPSIMSACDIVIHASTSPEPFGRVLIEAMALKKAVIATTGGGPEEIIEHGVNGLLVTPGNAESLAQSILILLKRVDLRNQLSTNGFLNSQKYTIKNHSDIIISAYKNHINTFKSNDH